MNGVDENAGIPNDPMISRRYDRQVEVTTT